MAVTRFVPFDSREMAAACARLLERITGDPCRVHYPNRDCYVILRQTGSGWVRG